VNEVDDIVVAETEIDTRDVKRGPASNVGSQYECLTITSTDPHGTVSTGAVQKLCKALSSFGIREFLHDGTSRT